MRVPLSWLQEYLGSDISSEVIDIACTNLGIEVDSIEEQKPLFQGVLIAKIARITAHPNPLEKLYIVDLFLDKEISYQVITSDSSCRIGMIVPFAPIGAYINGVVIEKAEFSGVYSFGMLLSEKELSIGYEEDRVLALPSHFSLGAALSSYVQESIFHLSLTPNLGHCLSVWGLAREIAAKLDIPLKKDWRNIPKTCDELCQSLGIVKTSEWEIDLSAPTACPYYSLMIADMQVSNRSPYSWRRKLFLSGMRSINSVVDALNIVMLEIGHPMHAFDGREAFHERKKLSVSYQKQKVSEFLLLNGEKKDLSEEILTVSNGFEKVLAIAGVIGGKEGSIEHEINNKIPPTGSQKIIIESAYFSMSSVRKSRKTLDCNTEASKRFERGVDPEGPVRGLYAFIVLMKEIDQTFSIERIEAVEKKENIPPCTKSILLRIHRIEQLLGFHIDRISVENVFRRLNYSFIWIDTEQMEVIVPGYRHDVHSEIDLIEDVAKIVGFSCFNLDISPKFRATMQENHILYEQEKNSRNAFISLGLQECVTSSLISPQSVEYIRDRPIPPDAIISVQNPMSQDQSILRPSLLPGLVEVVKNNLSFKQKNLSLFEIGTVFLRVDGNITEKSVVGVLLCGSQGLHSPFLDDRNVDFYDIKGILEDVCELLSIKDLSLEDSKELLFHPGRQASLMRGLQRVGLIGELHPQLVQDMNLPKRIYFMEIDLQDIYPSRQSQLVQVSDLKTYPSIERDITLLLPKKFPYEDLIKAIHKSSSPMLESCDLVSLFSDQKLGSEFHNVCLRMIFRDCYRTLEQGEVDHEFQAIVQKTMKQISPRIESITKNFTSTHNTLL